MEKEIVSEKKKKPQYDEQTLSNLLEAAFVLQEHNLRKRESVPASEPETEREKSEVIAPPRKQETRPDAAAAVAMPSPAIDRAAVLSFPRESGSPIESAKDDYTPTLAQIVETQHQIQVQHLRLEEALRVIAEGVMEITHAGGAGIGIIKDNKVVYDAIAGQMTLALGKEVPAEKALCSASLRTGHVIRSTHVNADFLIDGEECRRRGIHALIVAPVYHTGGVGGALELYYAGGQTFTEPDVHTCQLMAGLITEALARAEEQSWKKSLESERAVMLEALEKLKPNLAALVDASAAKKSAQAEVGATEPAASPSAGAASTGASADASPASTFICRKCGHSLVGEEQFCGNCGLPRGSDYEPPNMQSKVASLWHMQEAKKKSATANGNDSKADEENGESLEESLAAAGFWKNLPADSDALEGETKSSEPDDAELAESERAGGKLVDWSSAVSARDFLEQLKTRPGALTRFWNSRRGDIYLAIAVVLVVCVIRWGIWSDHPVGASGTAAAHSKPAPEPSLSLFDRMLISLGLAEAPDPPEIKGNPQTQVWVDTQTALYYCPGEDLYNNTPKGKFESQREAQLDQFSPALRKACN